MLARFDWIPVIDSVSLHLPAPPNAIVERDSDQPGGNCDRFLNWWRCVKALM